MGVLGLKPPGHLDGAIALPLPRGHFPGQRRGSREAPGEVTTPAACCRSSHNLDTFGEKPEFFDHGEPLLEHDLLGKMLAIVAGEGFKKDRIVLNALMLTHIPEYRFYHGGVTIEGRPGMILYFEAIGRDMISLSVNFGAVCAQFARFTPALLAQEKDTFNH